MKTAVAVLNWNGLALLQKFLPEVVQHSAGLAEIVVIDNCSSDNSVSWLQKEYPEVTVIINTENLGFAGGYNTGLRQVDADLFVLLNSDVQVTENWLPPLLNAFSDPKVVAAQPKVRSYNQPSFFEYAGAAGGFLDKDGFIFCRGRMFDHFERDNGQYDKNCEIFWATGACLAVHAESFWKVGGLDEDFFAHMEEIDLCWRLKNTGKSAMYCAESVVYHVGGGTLSKLSPKKTYLNFRNNLYLLLKNYRTSNVYLKLFRRMLMDGLAAYKFLVGGQLSHFGAVFKAHFTFYKNYRKFSDKRKSLNATIQNPNMVGYYKKSIVWAYFVSGKRRFTELNPKDFI